MLKLLREVDLVNRPGMPWYEINKDDTQKTHQRHDGLTFYLFELETRNPTRRV